MPASGLSKGDMQFVVGPSNKNQPWRDRPGDYGACSWARVVPRTSQMAVPGACGGVPGA